MKDTIKKFVITALGALALLSLYYGAYRPFVKAQMYLRAQRIAPSLGTVENIQNTYEKVFTYFSPIGDEETKKFFIEYLQHLMFSGKAPEQPLRELFAFAEERIDGNDVVHLVQMGNLYDALWRDTGNREYFDKAEEYYWRVLALGPRLPHPLYSLFNLYGTAGMAEELEAIGERILAIWPDDERVKDVLEEVRKSR